MADAYANLLSEMGVRVQGASARADNTATVAAQAHAELTSDTGVNLVIVAIGYMRGRTAPILDEAVTTATAVGRIIDPLPQALVLTAIVIGLGVTALMLAYAYRLFRRHRTLDIAAFRELKW